MNEPPERALARASPLLAWVAGVADAAMTGEATETESTTPIAATSASARLRSVVAHRLVPMGLPLACYPAFNCRSNLRIFRVPARQLRCGDYFSAGGLSA